VAIPVGNCGIGEFVTSNIPQDSAGISVVPPELASDEISSAGGKKGHKSDTLLTKLEAHLVCRIYKAPYFV